MRISLSRLGRQCLSLIVIAAMLTPSGLVWATCPVGTAGADTHTCTTSATAPVTYAGGAGNDALTIAASSTTTTTVDMGAGTDSVDLLAGSSVITSIIMGLATDLLTDIITNQGTI